MKQTVVTLLMVALIAGLMSMVVIGSNKKEQSVSIDRMAELREGDPIYYYGTTCPYCKVVAEWLDENKIAEKVNFTKKEVWSNQVNASELNRVAASCGLDTSTIGVPFLYAEGECLIGAPDIIGYFENKLEEMGSPVDPATNPLNQATEDLEQEEEENNETTN